MNCDRVVDLCLACSASLPPRRPSGNKATGQDVFTTQCCNRPICPTCILSNPRLARYNPCLRCLGGVGIVTARSTLKTSKGTLSPKHQNLDGGVHDDEVFAVGDDDDDDELDPESEPLEDNRAAPSTPPPAYTELEQVRAHNNEELSAPKYAKTSDALLVPSEYYIQPKDTLIGIALRFGVDGRLLCRLNGLPHSTLRTTPHLLHTCTTLKLPPSARNPKLSHPQSGPSDPEREARRAREKAEKRFQTVTKETDWRIAKAYVALAETGDHESLSKEDLPKKSQLDSTVEGRATDQYLDDEEWEERERREGRGVHIPRSPLTSQPNPQKGKGSTTYRWQWRQQP